MLQKIRNTKGFTLIELMIVGAIVGIFLAILVPIFISFMDDEESANSDIQIEQTIDEKEDEKSEGKLWNFYSPQTYIYQGMHKIK